MLLAWHAGEECFEQEAVLAAAAASASASARLCSSTRALLTSGPARGQTEEHSHCTSPRTGVLPTLCLWPPGWGRTRGRAWALTQVAEDDRQEDQAVQQAQHSDEEIETEEEDLDELGLRQAQD